MSDRGVCYFLCGNWAKYIGPMCVSLYTLRQHYHGPVCVLVGADSVIPADILISLHEIGATPKTGVPLAPVRRHKHYVTKATLWRHSPYGHTVLLDADTVVTGDIEAMFSNDFVATRFANWVSTGRKVGGRLRQWIPVLGQQVVLELTSRSWPAVNTGVVGWQRDCAFLDDWQQRSIAGHECSFTDELALQTYIPELIDSSWFSILDDSYNCSPTYGINRDDACIWHYHGRRMVRKPECRKMYARHLRDAWQHNCCGMQGWMEDYDGAFAAILSQDNE